MLIMPYFLLAFFPIIFAPIFISLSDLRPKEKLFYSLYPLALFILVYIFFHQKTSKPRSITFEAKGWYTIIYDVKNEMELKSKNGYREINFSKEPILLTSTKQMDIIPVSDSKYYYQNDKNIEPIKILYNDAVQYEANKQDSSIYIYFEVPETKNIHCFNKLNGNTSKEHFFIGTREEYFNRDSLYPESKRNIWTDNFFKAYCEKYH